MLVEVFAFIGFFTLIMYVLAEWGKHKIVGVLASLLLLMFGIFTYYDGIMFKVSETKLTTGTISEPCNCTIETAHTYDLNETTTPNYAPPAALPFIPITAAQLIGLVMFFASIYGLFYYSFTTIYPAKR